MSRRASDILYYLWLVALSAFVAAVFVFLALLCTHTVFGRAMQEPPPTQAAPPAGLDPALVLDEHGNPISQIVVEPFPALPAVDVTLPEVLQILSDYEVRHEGLLMSYLRYYGMTDPNTRTIFINSSVSQDYRVETVIHEILHVIYARRGYDTKGPYEPLVEAKAQEVYRNLYGGGSAK